MKSILSLLETDLRIMKWPLDVPEHSIYMYDGTMHIIAANMLTHCHSMFMNALIVKKLEEYTLLEKKWNDKTISKKGVID